MNIANTTIIQFIRRHIFAFGVFFVLFSFAFGCGSFVVANGQTLEPTDSHIVDLYVDGQDTTVPTKEATVGQFIAKAGVKLNTGDIVEPSENTLINADNFRIQVYRARPVTIIDGNTVTHILTPETSPQLIVKDAGISVYPQDTLTLTTTDNFVQNEVLGEELVINRATLVNLSLYGSPLLDYRTHAQTVGDFLKENNITPEAGATVTPGLSTPITTGLQIYISKYGQTVETDTEPVAFSTSTTDDPTQMSGVINVITPGVLGSKQVVYQVELKNGQPISKTELQEVVTVQPQTQVQTIGTLIPDDSGSQTSLMSAAGISASDYYYVDYIISHESSWHPADINSSGCYGLGQACPGSKLVAVCPDWQVDPVCQLRFFNTYAIGRYGSWDAAFHQEYQYGWW